MTIEILEGNCLDTISKIKPNSINTCVTSPPYWGLRDYNTGTWIGGDPNCPHMRKTKIGKNCITGHKNMFDQNNVVGDAFFKSECSICGAIRKDDQFGLEETPEEFVENLVQVFREVKRVLRDDGTVWLNLGDSYSSGGRTTTTNQTLRGNKDYGVTRPKPSEGIKPKDLVGIPWRVAFALQDNGWTLRSDVIWSKKAPMPESMAGTRYQDGVLRHGSWRSTSSHEHIFQLTKGMNYYSDGEAVKIKSIANHDAGSGYKRKSRLTYHDSDGIDKASDNGWEISPFANRRDVWRDISPEPYAGEHFATFPPDLPRLCIQASTSEAGVCGSCGNQWARVVEHTNATGTVTAEYGANIIASRPNNPHARSNVNGSSNLTLAWKPTCDCNADKIPATVLDPFAGTGTTLLAAQRLGRSGVGVDLSEDYLNQAVKRLSKETLPMVLI